MKKYQDASHVVVPRENTKDFLDAVSKHLDRLHKEGLQAEVQYQHSVTGFSALILGYREVDKL